MYHLLYEVEWKWSIPCTFLWLVFTLPLEKGSLTSRSADSRQPSFYKDTNYTVRYFHRFYIQMDHWKDIFHFPNPHALRIMCRRFYAIYRVIHNELLYQSQQIWIITFRDILNSTVVDAFKVGYKVLVEQSY